MTHPTSAASAWTPEHRGLPCWPSASRSSAMVRSQVMPSRRVSWTVRLCFQGIAAPNCVRKTQPEAPCEAKRSGDGALYWLYCTACQPTAFSDRAALLLAQPCPGLLAREQRLTLRSLAHPLLTWSRSLPVAGRFSCPCHRCSTVLFVRLLRCLHNAHLPCPKHRPL